MRFVISPDIFRKFPDLRVGVLVLHGVDNTKHNPEIASLLREAGEKVRSSFDLETFKEHPKIASLQEAHRAFGNNPNKFPPSHQALIKRILKGGQLPEINPLVDIYNIISLRHIVPAGGEDSDCLVGDVQLAFADGSEKFIPLGESDNDPPGEGEVVYRDDEGVICRKLDWREGDRTKLTEKTRNAVLVIEALPPVTEEELKSALSDMERLVQRFCGGSVEQFVLEVGREEVDL